MLPDFSFVQAENGTSVFVDCAYPRWFWISWSETDIVVGQGPDVGANVILSWTHAHHPIYNVAFGGIRDDVKWEFTHIPGRTT